MNWSQKDFAREAGIGISAVAKIEASDGNLTLRILEAAVHNLEAAGLTYDGKTEDGGAAIRIRKGSRAFKLLHNTE